MNEWITYETRIRLTFLHVHCNWKCPAIIATVLLRCSIEVPPKTRLFR